MGSCACARFGAWAVCLVLVLVITQPAALEGKSRKNMLRDAASGGIVVWAYARSATGTFCNTLRRASGQRWCNGQKEGWRQDTWFRGPPITPRNIKACVGRGERITMIKPDHIKHKTSELPRPDDLMRSLKAAGFTVVVGWFRFNLLAQWASVYELRKRALGKVDKLNYCSATEAIREWQQIYADWREGMDAAAAANLTVVHLRYPSDVPGDVCPSISRTLRAAGWSVARPCAVAKSGTPDSRSRRQGMSLEHRIGAKNAECARAAAESMPETAWMLDDNLGRADPPEGFEGFLAGRL